MPLILGKNYRLTNKVSTFNLNTTNNEPFARVGTNVGRDCDVTFNLVNTKINMTTSKAENGGDNGRSCFNLLTCGITTFNIDATSALTMNGQYMRSMFYDGTGSAGALVLNLAEGAVIAINDCAANAPFITANMAGKVTINDKGADWVIGETAAAKGVTLPVFAAGKTVIGYAKDGKLYKTVATVAGTYKAKDFANVVAFSAEDFDMIDGASLRTVYGESGIRFSMMISDEPMAALEGVDGYEFHMLIAPTENIGEGELDANVLDVVDVKSTKTQTPGEINGVAYDNLRHVAVLMPDTVEAYTLELGARAYIAVTYADGSVATFYTEYDENNVRSMLDVAIALDATGEYDNNAAVQEILTACNAK